MNPDIYAELNLITERILALEMRVNVHRDMTRMDLDSLESRVNELEEDGLGVRPEIERLEKEMAWIRRQHEAI